MAEKIKNLCDIITNKTWIILPSVFKYTLSSQQNI